MSSESQVRLSWTERRKTCQRASSLFSGNKEEKGLVEGCWVGPGAFVDPLQAPSPRLSPLRQRGGGPYRAGRLAKPASQYIVLGWAGLGWTGWGLAGLGCAGGFFETV